MRLRFHDATPKDVALIAALQNAAACALTARFGPGHWSSLVTERSAALSQRHVASVLRGYLIFRSGYLPKVLGGLLALGGLGFITKNFVVVLAPAYASDLLLLPMFLAGVSLTVWLLVRGVDIPQW